MSNLVIKYLNVVLVKFLVKISPVCMLIGRNKCEEENIIIYIFFDEMTINYVK